MKLVSKYTHENQNARLIYPTYWSGAGEAWRLFVKPYRWWYWYHRQGWGYFRNIFPGWFFYCYCQWSCDDSAFTMVIHCVGRFWAGMGRWESFWKSVFIVDAAYEQYCILFNEWARKFWTAIYGTQSRGKDLYHCGWLVLWLYDGCGAVQRTMEFRWHANDHSNNANKGLWYRRRLEQTG